MKKRILLPILCLTAFLFGCTSPEPAPVETTQLATAPTIDGAAAYHAAREAVLEADNRVLTYGMSTVWTQGQQRVTDSFTGTASLAGCLGDALTAVIEEDLSYGSYRESFDAGVSYIRSGSSVFRGETSSEAFLQRQMPAVLLDDGLYREAETLQDGAQWRILFSGAAGPESWADVPQDARLLSASGEAVLDADLALVKTGYTLSYEIGGRVCTVTAQVQVSTPKELNLEDHFQDRFDNCPLLADIRVPRMMLQTVGKIFSATGFEAEISESIHSEILNFTHNKESSINISGKDAGMDAAINTHLVVSDYRGEVSNTQMGEVFAEGRYSSWINGGNHAYDPSVTAQQVRQYCEDLLLSGLMASKYLSDATLTQGEEEMVLTMNASDMFAADIMAHLTAVLQADLDSRATSIQTPEAQGYLVLEEGTGLPTAMGIHFRRNHTVDNVTYALNYDLTETLNLFPAAE